MSVDPKHHRYFVARRGQVLREIADEYGGVMVSFPRTGSQSDKVTLKGAKDCVEAAKKRMQEIIEDLVNLYCALILNILEQTGTLCLLLCFEGFLYEMLPREHFTV